MESDGHFEIGALAQWAGVSVGAPSVTRGRRAGGDPVRRGGGGAGGPSD